MDEEEARLRVGKSVTAALGQVDSKISVSVTMDEIVDELLPIWQAPAEIAKTLTE
jgi:hypothetical protein